MKNLTTSDFPQDFVWGAATASYQVEGAVSEDGRGPSIWDTFAHTPGRIADAAVGDVADDHYHRYVEDITLMADLGLTAYRFSIAWPRIQPNGSGTALKSGLGFYRRLAECCLENGVTPYATLYHWDLPQSLEDAGGWLQRDTSLRFADYAGLAQDGLGDLITNWITLNEPWCSAFLGYAAGVHAPGLTLGKESMKAVHHLLLGHGLAVRRLRESTEPTTVGLTVNLYAVTPATESPVDREAARRADGIQNRLFLDPVLSGRYPDDVLEDVGCESWFEQFADDLAVISEPLDFLGVNYYSRHTVSGPADGVFADPTVVSTQPGSERIETVDTGAAKTQMGWEIHPDGLVEVLELVHERAPELPLYVTENGSAWEDRIELDGTIQDEQRRDYLEQHIGACRESLRRGIPLRGYFAWSLIDNFEWSFGFSRRFGLIYVDYPTQQRTVKRSGWWLKEFLTDQQS